MAGILSIVGTPIGNLSDASPRVLDTLAAANTVLCEDTRVTSKLLARFEIHTSLERCDENVIASRIPAVLERLRAGERIAFVSDAGMPGISDPGQRLVDAALDEGLAVEVVPGPSALTCALVASGIACDHFFFEGFLPRKPTSRTSRLSELARVPGALIFYESPRRVAATLAAIAEVMPARQVALVRELTKIHEEVVRASAPTLAAQIAEREEIRGECVVVVAPPTHSEQADFARMMAALEAMQDSSPVSLDDAIRAGLAANESKANLAKRLSKQFGRSRSEVYDRVVELASE